MSLEERRRQLRALFAHGIASREEINQLVGMAHASFEDDLRATLALADSDSLRLLRRKLRQGQVVRQAYRGPGGSGCVMHFAFGFNSNEDLYDFPHYESEEALDAMVRCVRAWDFELLAPATVFRVLDETIQERKRINDLEDAAVRRSAARKARTTATATR